MAKIIKYDICMYVYTTELGEIVFALGHEGQIEHQKMRYPII